MDSLKAQVGEKCDSKEDGGNSTSNKTNEGEDGALHLINIGVSGEVLHKDTKQCVMHQNAIIFRQKYVFLLNTSFFILTKKPRFQLLMLTSSTAKLVKWLQLHVVSVSVLFTREQPLVFQPPAPPAIRYKSD